MGEPVGRGHGAEPDGGAHRLREAARWRPLCASSRTMRQSCDTLDKSLLGEVSKRAEQRDAKREQLLRQHRQELAEELARSTARLAAEFPDYADLVNPKPLSLVAGTEAACSRRGAGALPCQ